jgi:hypothetical protein
VCAASQGREAVRGGIAKRIPLFHALAVMAGLDQPDPDTRFLIALSARLLNRKSRYRIEALGAQNEP